MRIGSCSLINEWKMIADIGYDYVETNFSRIVRLTDEEFEDAKLQLAESGLKLEACNGFFHSKFVLYAYDPETGEGTDAFADIEKEVLEYVRLGFDRVSRMGTKVVVIGSGGARTIPDGMKRRSPSGSLQEFSQFAATRRLSTASLSRSSPSIIPRPTPSTRSPTASTSSRRSVTPTCSR